MPRSTVYRTKTRSGDVSTNMTPMIDCVFQLMIFFILTSQIASQSLSRLELYEPWRSQALKWSEKDPNRVIVNVPSMAELGVEVEDSPLASQGRGYFIGGKKFDVGDTAALTEEFRNRSAAYVDKGADFFVEIRADRRVTYSDVEPILWAAAEARIPKMNITALLGSKGLDR